MSPSHCGCLTVALGREVRSRDSSELDRVLAISSRETLKSPCLQNSRLARLPVIATECPSYAVQGVTGANSWEREPLLVTRVIRAEE